MTKALRFILFALATCAAALLAYGSYIAWSFHYGIEAERSAFSSTAWNDKANVYAHSNDPGCVRGGMALDIIATGLLQKKSLTEIKSLLGEPDGTMADGVYFELGQCSGLGWHNSILKIYFNKNQEFAKAAIIRR